MAKYIGADFIGAKVRRCYLSGCESWIEDPAKTIPLALWFNVEDGKDTGVRLFPDSWNLNRGSALDFRPYG